MIHDAWFTFNGIDSRSMGIIVTKMPETVRAERRVERLEIPGRNGSLHIDEGTYSSYDRSMECAVIERRNIDKIAAWLVGAGEMVFSTEPDKLYRVYIANKIDISQMMRVFQKFIVTMDTQPFKYRVNGETDKIVIAPEDGFMYQATIKINNIGTVYSEPIMLIEGVGSGKITVINAFGETEIGMLFTGAAVTIDSGLREVYTQSWNINDRVTGNFPRFAVGENVVKIEMATLDYMEIMPMWRWL